MREEYLTAKEYETFFEHLHGVRRQIVRRLPIEPGMRLLDLATGYGYFSMEIARLWGDIGIVSIDLVKNDVDKTRGTVRSQGLVHRIALAQMDATRMGFRDKSFDLVVNFLGLEDIHMTRGEFGVQKTFGEVGRVLQPQGRFWFTAMPPEEMETRAQQLETEVFSYACGATWLRAEQYIGMLAASGFELSGQETYYTGKKLAQAQAREYIRFACDQVPAIFGRPTASFQEVWRRYGREIEKEGLGYCSKVVLFRTRRTKRT